MTAAVRPATKHDFDVLSASPSPLLFNWEFVERLSAATGFPNRSLVVRDGDDEFLVPVLRRRAFRVIPLDFSLPFGLAGSVYPRPDDPAQEAAILHAAQRHLGAGLVAHNSTHPASLPGVQVVAAEVTHVLMTRGLDYATLSARAFGPQVRRKIRKAEKSRLTVRAGNDTAMLDDFYALYLLSNERWGTKSPKYSRAFFQAFSGLPAFSVKLALHDHRPVAGVVILKFRDQHVYWFGALDKRYGSLCPNHLLFPLALTEAIAAGVECLNFGASGRLSGVRRFKESFGGEVRHYSSFFFGSRVVGTALGRRMRRA